MGLDTEAKAMPLVLPREKIDLNRRFMPLSEGPTGLHVETYLQVVQRVDKGLTWEEILSTRWVVVLGEAGTGKSTEFKLRPAILRDRGTRAFFMDITALAQDGPELAVTTEDIELLRTWRDSSEESTFFLDSLDEAELRQLSLQRALRKLGIYAGDARSRARIVVSCRVSDWSTASGYRDMIEYICGAGGAPKDLTLVQLMPLDDDQVKQLARHHGVSDAESLLEAVQEASAQPFVARPLDVEWLVDYWEEHHEIGSLTELVERSVTKRLDERRPTSCPRSPLPKDRTRSGIMRLAGLAVLCGRWSFLVPGEESIGAGQSDTIDPREALEEWSDNEIRELLTRAVFDESTYGRVRFHHRTVQEYLAAKWIQSKIQDGLRRRDLDRLLVRELGGRPFVPAYLIPTAAWLSLWVPNVLMRLTVVEPEALFQHGDPAGHTQEARERVLSAYLGRYAGREHLYDHFDRDALRRFSPALEVAVSNHLSRTDLPQEAIRFLLELAAEGKLRSCRQEAAKWAANSTADSYLRCEAIRAAAALASEAENRRLVGQLVGNQRAWNQNVAGVFASQFFPSVLSPTDVGQLLRLVIPEAPNYHTSIKTFVIHQLPNCCLDADRLLMLYELAKSVRQTDHDQGWLLHGLQELSRVIIEAMSENEEPAVELKDALTLFQSIGERPWDGSVALDSLRRAIAGKPRVRRWLFWMQATEVRERQNGDWPKHSFELYHPRALSKIQVQDADWLAADARSHSENGARQLAFATLLQWNGSSADVSELILSTASSSTDPLLNEMLSTVSARRSTPRTPAEWEIKMEEAQRAKDLEASSIHADNLRVLMDNIHQIRSGSHLGLIDWIGSRARPGGELGVALEKVREEFGQEIAEATASGLKACWRKARPLFHFEQEQRNLIPGEVVLGLAGLQLEFDAGLDPAHLDDSEIEVATRYAARQLNRFPEWFDRLANTHPKKVVDAFSPAIQADLCLTDPTLHPEILGRWRGLPDAIRQLTATVVLRELRRRNPEHEQSLEDALRICDWLSPNEIQSFITLCTDRLDEAGSIKLGVLWWLAAARRDPVGAVRHLQDFGQGAKREDFDAVAEATCARLGGDASERDPAASVILSDTEALEQLIPIVYEAIREADDVGFRSGQARFIGPRDNAQSFRDRLFNDLAAIGTPEAFMALERLAVDPRMNRHRDILLRHVRHSPQRSLQALPMTPVESMNWSRTHAAPVRSADDLHRVALDRLDDVREHVERGESSSRALFEQADEKKFQPWFMEQLELRNRYGYTVHREEEADRKKMPDIRLAHSACPNHPTSIEIKVAENWTGPDLRKALFEQLVRRYMRASKSRHGILLLCSRGNTKKWKLGGKRLSFSETLKFLQLEADALLAEQDDIDALTVVDIDFHLHLDRDG